MASISGTLMTIWLTPDQRVGDGVAVGRPVPEPAPSSRGGAERSISAGGQRQVERRQVEHDVVAAVAPAGTEADRRAEQRVVGDHDRASAAPARPGAARAARRRAARPACGHRGAVLQIEHQAAGRLGIEPPLLDRHREAEQPGRVRRLVRVVDRAVGHDRDAVGGQHVERLVLDKVVAAFGADAREDAAHAGEVGGDVQHAAGRQLARRLPGAALQHELMEARAPPARARRTPACRPPTAGADARPRSSRRARRRSAAC